ncbi:hypothetical protein ACH5RR_029446 [Cinchona calisaya]|uniref:SAWADEE domain-containing protein n=1 Tax=Cinchona calisaya TaxID=153742 RepID=A0ABD2YV78_9GENT
MADFMHVHQTTAISEYDMEFRSKDDDAWYSVRLVLSEGEETLTVKFQGFSEVSDLSFKVNEFENAAAVDEFVKRFRPVSKQLQDTDCLEVVKGMKVCAALSCREDDLRFYDAVVDDVCHRAHLFRNGEEECPCTFVLFWLHGPESANLSIVNIASICTIHGAVQADHKIASFSKLAREKMAIACFKSCIGSEYCTSKLGVPFSCKEVVYLSSNEKSSCESRLQDNEIESCCGNRGKDEERVTLGADVDEDLGGYDSVESVGHHYVMIENLEKDLSTSSIRRFICENTSVSLQACLFTSWSSAPSASGAISSNSKKSVEKIYEFLVNPKHLIVSARGRPWVVSGKILTGTFIGILPNESQNVIEKDSLNKELKVVHTGTEAYKIAKQMRDLYMEYANHKQLLSRRLAWEECRILESSPSRETSHRHTRSITYEGC